jgi:hypothetical protein
MPRGYRYSRGASLILGFRNVDDLERHQGKSMVIEKRTHRGRDPF